MQTNLQSRPASAPPARPNRMTLGALTRGKINAPCRILFFAPEGLGKSTLGASILDSIFLAAEEGTNHLDVARFPRPEAWNDVFDAIETLRVEPHGFKTLVIDTVDALEPLCWAHVCQAAGKPDIESFGFGKGYVAALGEWQRFLAALEGLRRDRGMMILTLAHAQVRTWKNPAGADFDRYTLKLHEKAAGLLKEWHDAVLFGHYEEYAEKGDGRRAKGVSTGARVIHTVRTAAWDAKNRFSLPPTLPLNWDDLAAAIAAGRPAEPAKLREEVAALAASIGDADLTAKVDAAVEKVGEDAAALARIKDRLSAKIAQKES